MSNAVLPILYSFVLAGIGWKFAVMVKMPAPAMIGPMLIIAVAATAGVPQMQMDPLLRIGIQSIIGGYLGRRINRTSVRSLMKLTPAIALTTMWYVTATGIIGWLVARWAFVDLGSAYLATAPGGVTEMTALAITSGVDVAFVAAFQTLRIMLSNLFMPIIARWTPVPPRTSSESECSRTDNAFHPSESSSRSGKSLPRIGTVQAGLTGSAVFTLLSIPAGGILGSLTVTSILQLQGIETAPVPKPVLSGMYMMLGISVGASFSMDAFVKLQGSLWILAGATLATLASSIVLSFVVKSVMKLDLRTSLLACSPGGLSMMAVVAEETGAQSVVVSMLHLVRIVWIVITMPFFMMIVL